MIDYSMPTPHESTPISLSRVHDLDFLKSEASRLGIFPSRNNIRRVRRAYDIVENHTIRKIESIDVARIYEVDSQSRDLVHLVVANGDRLCTCEDARRRSEFTGCKHSIAVQIYEEQMLDLESNDVPTFNLTKTRQKMTLITDTMSEGVYYSLSHSNKTKFHISIDENDGRDDFTLNFDNLELALKHLKESYGEGIYQEFIENLID